MTNRDSHHSNHKAEQRLLTSQRFAASLAVAGVLGLGTVGVPGAQWTASNASAQAVKTDQGTSSQDVKLSSQVVDQAGVLNGSQKSELEKSLQEATKESGVKMYVVYVPVIEGNAQTYAKNLLAQAGAPNSLVMAVSTENRQLAFAPGPTASQKLKDGQGEKIRKAALDHAVNSEWFDAGKAASDKLAGKTSPSTYAWMGAAGVAVIGGGAGALAVSRRKRKTQEHEQIQAAKALDPERTSDLQQQPTHVLRTLASDELKSTDESIRKGQEELELARGEFGDNRTSSLARAVDHSQRTLREAYALHQQAQSASHVNEDDERDRLVQIISSCGTADKQLNAEAENFATMRQELIDAPSTLDSLLQSTVSLRARIPGAREQLDALQQTVNPELLSSVIHNPEVAEQEISVAERAINEGKTLADKPAGQQGGLVDAIGTAQLAIRKADTTLRAVEDAQSHLRDAQNNLPSLVKEVEDELTEAEQLRQAGSAVDSSQLREAQQKAEQALEKARQTGDRDPLGAYSTLVEADGVLDDALDVARGRAREHKRSVEVVDRTLSDTDLQLRSVENTIQTHGSIIGTQARSSAEAARREAEEARRLRETDTNAATQHAREAHRLATTAAQQVNDDIHHFNQQRMTGGFGRGYGGGFGGGNGGLITGMVLGSLLNGGGFGGGYGGGFGDGDGGFGGGFGGDGGGGWDGGWDSF